MSLLIACCFVLSCELSAHPLKALERQECMFAHLCDFVQSLWSRWCGTQSQTVQGLSAFEALPTEILLKIGTYLEPKDRGCLALTSTRMWDVCRRLPVKGQARLVNMEKYEHVIWDMLFLKGFVGLYDRGLQKRLVDATHLQPGGMLVLGGCYPTVQELFVQKWRRAAGQERPGFRLGYAGHLSEFTCINVPLCYLYLRKERHYMTDEPEDTQATLKRAEHLRFAKGAEIIFDQCAGLVQEAVMAQCKDRFVKVGYRGDLGDFKLKKYPLSLVVLDCMSWKHLEEFVTLLEDPKLPEACWPIRLRRSAVFVWRSFGYDKVHAALRKRFGEHIMIQYKPNERALSLRSCAYRVDVKT